MTGMTRVFSGIQPTGQPHLGSLLGAIRHWVAEQGEYDSLICVVDLHALTVTRDPDELRSATLELATALIAAGIDPERTLLFVQGHVGELHAELAWLLNCVATYGELQRMTQFKEKSDGRSSVSVGVFDYPVLQAADVLLYQAERVPVGDDQRQHLELMRDLAIRFNGRYGDTFAVPEASIPRVGARIMDLQNPTAKMSKTGGTAQGTLWMLDEPTRLRKKVMSAVTDSGSEVRTGADKPGVTALLEILAAVEGSTPDDAAAPFAGSGYGTFKAAVAEAVIEFLVPMQERYAELARDPGEIQRMLRANAERARALAEPTLTRAKQAVGLLAP